MFDKLFLFFKDKFEVILLFSLVIIIFLAWLRSDYNVSVKEVLMFVLGAMTALMRIVPRPTQTVKADSVTAENIEAASTESGDIVTATDPQEISTKPTEKIKQEDL